MLERFREKTDLTNFSQIVENDKVDVGKKVNQVTTKLVRTTPEGVLIYTNTAAENDCKLSKKELSKVKNFKNVDEIANLKYEGKEVKQIGSTGL